MVDSIISRNYHGCKWKFTRNYVRALNSRKDGPFFQCCAKCSIPGCQLTLTLIVRNQNDGISELTFQGTRHHLPGTLFARNIKGARRDEYGEKFRKNHHLDPSEFYRETLSSISPD